MWGMVIFAERPSPLMWVSAALLIASLYLIGKRESARSTSGGDQA